MSKHSPFDADPIESPKDGGIVRVGHQAPGKPVIKVIPFPRNWNRLFVQKHAAHIARLPEKTAEKLLAHQLQVQAQTMARRGIAPETIENEIRALESDIRAALGMAACLAEARHDQEK